MLNLLKDYICDSIPHGGTFSTNPNLEKKVDKEGRFLPFYGNTVVFDLDLDTKNRLKRLQEKLYAGAGDLLSRPISPDTFHMTLHDLVNGPPQTPGLAQRMDETGDQAKVLLMQWRNLPSVRMVGTWMFNMVNTSIVLGLEPADGDSYGQLDAMYQAMENIVHLGYALTPHITLAYFRPGTAEGGALERLRQVLSPEPLHITLTMENFVYQTFSDMDHYQTITQKNN